MQTFEPAICVDQFVGPTQTFSETISTLQIEHYLRPNESNIIIAPSSIRDETLSRIDSTISEQNHSQPLISRDLHSSKSIVPNNNSTACRSFLERY